MLRKATIVLAFASLAACGPTETVKIQDSVSLKGKPVLVSLERPDPFLPMTREASMFAVVGVLGAVENGKKQIREFGLVDPSIGIEKSLLPHVINKYGLRGTGSTVDFRSSKAPSDFAAWAKKSGHSGVLLDVRTKGWGYSFVGIGFGKYSVGYTGEMTLVDLDAGKILAQHRCSKTSDGLNGGKYYTKEQLTASRGKLLKEWYGKIQSACLAEFRTKAL